MTRASITADGRPWTVAGLSPKLRGHVFQAVVIAQVVDSASRARVAGPIRVATPTAGLRARIADSGFVGLAGVPSRVFPDLAATAHEVELTISAPGYLARTRRVTIPAQAGFPGQFLGRDLGALELHREPVTLQVATYELDPSDRPQGLSGATVRVVRSWERLDGLGAAGATAPLLAVSPGLSVARPPGSALDLPALAMPAEPPRTLLTGVPAGATTVPVTSTTGMVPGELVGLDLAVPDRAERIEVVAIHGPSDPLSPAVLELRHPTGHGHAAGSPARRIHAPAAPGAPATTLTRAALVGDRTLVLAAPGGVAAGQVVRITGGGPAEYLAADLYETTTGPDGAGRLPALSGLAAVEVEATSGALGAGARLTLTQTTPALDLTLT